MGIDLQTEQDFQRLLNAATGDAPTTKPPSPQSVPSAPSPTPMTGDRPVVVVSVDETKKVMKFRFVRYTSAKPTPGEFEFFGREMVGYPEETLDYKQYVPFVPTTPEIVNNNSAVLFARQDARGAWIVKLKTLDLWVLSVGVDHLVCSVASFTTPDPDAPASPPATFKVRLPPNLRKTPFHGKTRDGFTYDYESNILRKSVSATDPENEETQEITPSFVGRSEGWPGDVITAAYEPIVAGAVKVNGVNLHWVYKGERAWAQSAASAEPPADPEPLSASTPAPPADAADQLYAPADPDDWNDPDPTTVAEALDALAAEAGGTGAPTTAEYVVMSAHGSLSNERVLSAGVGLKMDDGGPNDPVTLTPTSYVAITGVTGAGTISNKTFEGGTVPANHILTAFESDDDAVTIAGEVDAGPNALGVTSGWQPKVTVSGGDAPVVATLTQVAGTRFWTWSATIVGSSSGTITATTDDGGTSQSVTYTRSLDPPLVLTAIFDNQGTNPDPYPAVQTQVKSSDTVEISGTTESHADEVYVKDFELTNGEGEQGPFAVTAGVWSGTLNVGTGTLNTSHYKCYAKVTGGSAGADFTTSATVDKDQTLPTFSGGAQSDITYPATQEALKDAETCSVTVTHTNIAAGDTYLYDDNSSGELTIPSTTTYSATKTGVPRLAGNYRESGTNYRLTATRTTKNGASATKIVTVKIAHAMPILTVTPTTRMRTDDGTNNYKDHTITLTSSQANLSTHTAVMDHDAADAADWKPASSWATSGDLAYTRDFRVEDADIVAGGQAANTFTWGSGGSISVKNRAGKIATTITTNPSYTIGGFEKRRLTIPAWTNREADISVKVVNTAKLVAELLSKGGSGPGGGTIQTFDNSPGQGLTPTDEPNEFCISDGADLVDDDNQFYYNKDQAAAEANSGGTAQVDIEETA